MKYSLLSIIDNVIHKDTRKSIFHFIVTCNWIMIFFSSNFNPLQSKTFYYGFKSLIIFFYSGLVSDDSLKSTVHFNGTMNFYWNNCKMKNKFITGNTDIVCQNTATWTGIRKYKIGTNKVFKLLYDVNFLLMINERIV